MRLLQNIQTKQYFEISGIIVTPQKIGIFVGNVNEDNGSIYIILANPHTGVTKLVEANLEELDQVFNTSIFYDHDLEDAPPPSQEWAWMDN